MGLAGLVLAMAPSLGPSFGGIIAYYFNWRVIFSISSVLAIIVILIGLRVVGIFMMKLVILVSIGCVTLSLACLWLILHL